MQNILSKKINIFLILLFTYFLNFFYNVYLTHHLGPKDYGEIALVLRIMIFIFPFFLMGSSDSMSRFVPLYLEKKQFSLYFGFHHWAFKQFVLSLLILLVVNSFLIVWVLINPFEQLIFTNYHFLLYSLWLIPLYSLMIYLGTLLRCLHHQKLGSIFGFYPALSLLFLMVFKYFDPFINNIKVIISIGLSIILLLLFNLVIIFRKSPPSTTKKINNELKNEWKKVSFHMMWNTIIWIGIASIDIFMMELLDTKINVGRLNVILTITNIFPIIENASNSIIIPYISPLFFNNDLKKMQQLFNKSIFFRFSIGLLLAIIILCFHNSLLAAFGPNYLILGGSLITLTIGYILYLLFSTAAMFLLYTGHQNILFKINLAQLFLVVILDYFLIPRFHVAGAVSSLIVGFLFAEFLSFLALHFYLKIKLLVFV